MALINNDVPIAKYRFGEGYYKRHANGTWWEYRLDDPVRLGFPGHPAKPTNMLYFGWVNISNCTKKVKILEMTYTSCKPVGV